MNAAEARWQSLQTRALAESSRRAAGALVRAVEGGPPGLVDACRMLEVAAGELADRARRVGHRIEAELHHDHDLPPAA